jgi:hypothetical protein
VSAVADYVRGPQVPVRLFDGDTMILETTGRAKARVNNDGRLVVEIEVDPERKIHVTAWESPAIRGMSPTPFREGRLTVPRKATLTLEMLLYRDLSCPNGLDCPLGLGA